MKLIQSIVDHIDQRAFTEFIKGKRKPLELFQLVAAHKVDNDIDAAKLLYGDATSSNNYKQIKNRLSQYLIDYVFKQGLVGAFNDDYSRTRHKCLQTIALISQLISINERKLAMKIAETILKTFGKWDFTAEMLQLTRELTIYYGAIAFDIKKYKKYSELTQSYQRTLSCELLAEQHYAELRLNFKHSDIAKRRSAAATADKYAAELQKYMDKGIRSYQFTFIYYLVLSTRCQLKQDYSELMRVCSKAVQVLSGMHAYRVVSIFLFDLRKILCYILFDKHNEAERIAIKYIPRMTRGGTNWLVLQLYIFISRMHRRQYMGAYEIYNEVVGNKYHLRQEQNIKERWLIVSAFMAFLHQKGVIDIKKPFNFRIGKLLNEIPIYNKDKRGLNISILVIQYILLLQQRRYPDVIDRMEALKQYCFRYLRKDDFFRPHCFIRMLLQIPRADFNRIRTERYAEPYLKKLKSVPLKLSEQSIEVEIIPYEDLWDMTLDLLD